MAISFGARNAGRMRQAANRTSQEWLELAVRTALLVYLAAVAVLHAAVVPKIFATLRTPCEPGGCLWGQLQESTLDQIARRGVSADAYGLVATVLPLLIPLVGSTLAAIVIWQRPTNWLPVLFVTAIATCTLGASGAFSVLMIERPEWELPIKFLHIPMAVAWPLMPLLFPDGRFVPRWSAIFVVLVALDVALIFRPELIADAPIAVQRALEMWWVVVGCAAVLWRLRVTTDRRTRRQVQIWFVALLPIFAYAGLTFALTDPESPPGLAGTLWTIADQAVWAVGVLVFLFGFLMAIYLYNVYDLSIVIRRSIVYGLLTVALIGVYLLTVAVVSTLVRSEESAVPAMLATVVIALGFAPLRTWLQQRVRDLLYGDEADPYGVLSRFGQQLEETSAPERLLGSLVDLAQDMLRVPGVALAISGAPELSVRAGTVESDAVVVPVRYQGEAVGALAVSPRGPAESFSPADRRLIEEIARQTGIAVHSTLLSESLKQSREQIVTAREEERRRIRNDLHDGLGPALAALSLQVEIARDLIGTDPDRSTKLLEDVLGQTRESILDIRRLVYDLRPPALDDLGLTGAIRAQAQRWEERGLAIELELAEELPPLTAATEVALFRIAQEALTNVAKHAGATTVWVRLGAEHGVVRLDVADNGQGMSDRAVAGVGMRSMRERAEELGGRLSAGNGPDGGVAVMAEFDLLGDGAEPQ